MGPAGTSKGKLGGILICVSVFQEIQVQNYGIGILGGNKTRAARTKVSKKLEVSRIDIFSENKTPVARTKASKKMKLRKNS